MREYLMLLPVIFIFHDMEEVVGFEWFFRKNPDLIERFPRVLSHYRELTTAGFASGVYEELILFGGVSVAAYFLPCNALDALWYGMMLALTAHFAVHIAQVICIRRYIPCIITSVICLPASVVILVRCAGSMVFDTAEILCISAGVLLSAINLMILTRTMGAVSKRLEAT